MCTFFMFLGKSSMWFLEMILLTNNIYNVLNTYALILLIRGLFRNFFWVNHLPWAMNPWLIELRAKLFFELLIEISIENTSNYSHPHIGVRVRTRILFILFIYFSHLFIYYYYLFFFFWGGGFLFIISKCWDLIIH